MRIVIDLQGAQTESRFRGIGFYSLSLAKAIARNRGNHEIIIVLNGLFPDTIEPIRAEFVELLPQENICVWYAPGPVSEDEPNNRLRREAAELIREAFIANLNPDIVHITSLIEGYIDDAVTSIGCFDRKVPVSISLYDLIPLLNPSEYLQPDPIFEKYYQRKIDHLKRSSLLLAISEFSREEGINYLGIISDSIINVSTAADPRFQPMSLDNKQEQLLREKFNLSQPFILCAGGADTRKNLPRLVRAYAKLSTELRNNLQLVLTGKMLESTIHKLKLEAKKAGLNSDELIILGYVTHDEMVKLYNLSKLYVFPSWHEGFGLPALEAMSCGTAVIGSNTTSLPEVIGNEDALFDPLSEEAIADKIAYVLTNDAFRTELKQRGIEQAKKFSWDNSASYAIVAFEQLHTEHKKRIASMPLRVHRPKMAFISPLPPERSGISDYSAELLPELSHYYDIDVIVAQESVSDSWVNTNCQIRDVEWFREHASHYKRILYQFGNSHYHEYMHSLFRETPGVIVLHDFFLSGSIYNMGFKEFAPNSWENELYIAHGYNALQQRFSTADKHDTVMKFPCNYSVLRDAKGVIVHSEHAQQLTRHWYPSYDENDWRIIPLLRTPVSKQDRTIARNILSLNADDFVVCSFGMLDPTKLSQRLLDAWLSSDLSKANNCVLIFVGENHAGIYGQELLTTIQHSGLKKRINITGWVDTETFRNYLAAADIGVQLRSLSRGETSATVLDCMNYGLPTIVNAHGSMAALPDDAVWMLPDEFSDEQLIETLESLWRDKSYCRKLGDKALDVIATHHAPDKCASQYYDAIEHYYHKAKTDRQSLIQAIAESGAQQLNKQELINLSLSIAKSIPDKQPARQLLLDISATCRNKLNTGIERVTHSILLQLINNPPEGYKVEPVYLTDQGGTWHYRYARNYTCSLLDIPRNILQDDVVEFYTGDTLFSSDYSGEMVVLAEQSGLYKSIRESSVKIFFVVHDLLPIIMDQYFPPNSNKGFEFWLRSVCRISDGIICDAKSITEDVQYWLSKQKENINLELYWSHLGADIQASTLSTRELNTHENTILKLVKSRSTFLMVGTIEPRKGHIQTLDAFDIIWRDGGDINLVIVGNEGWQGLANEQRRTIPEIVDQFNNHPELNKRLFWLKNASDELLEQLYATSTCLIAASEGEGFGLPLIEAAQNNLPIIARGTNVFREVAQEHAYYFSGYAPENIANAVQNWLGLYKNNKHPAPSEIPWLTWEESVSKLGEIICCTATKEHTKSEVKNLDKLDIEPSKRLYVDITIIVENDIKTGIQRVTRSILHALLKESPPDFKVIPVCLTCVNDVWKYKSAISYITKHIPELNSSESIQDNYIDIGLNDIVLGLDLAGAHVVSAASQGMFRQIKEQGAKVYFVVHDLIPVTMPDFFSQSDTLGHAEWLTATTQGNGVLCVSEATASEYRKWLAKNPGEADSKYTVKSFHEGADIENSLPSKGFTHNDSLIIDKIKQRVSFLQVGSLEPRKGHMQTLSAFEELWSKGHDINLVIVGNSGWMMDELSTKLQLHPQRDKKLFWLKGISDEYLEKIYNAADCLIAPSEGEGFGLPLIEAAKHRLPIIARDLPVFNEVAGKHAYYFDGKESTILANAVVEWLSLFDMGKHPKSSGLHFLSWDQSAKELSKLLIY